MTSPSRHPGKADQDLPLRVSTLELFFDLVFVFAITQLTGTLACDMTLAARYRGRPGGAQSPRDGTADTVDA